MIKITWLHASFVLKKLQKRNLDLLKKTLAYEKNVIKIIQNFYCFCFRAVL